MITKEELLQELESLKQQEETHIANVQMVRGAKQLCEHLISQCKEAKEDE